MKKENREKLVLVDAHAYLHRAFHALPPLTNSGGQPVNAIYGFARTLLKLIAEQKPMSLVVCFDAPGKVFREEVYAEYKATRKETDPDLKSQFSISRELVEAMGLASFETSGFEADDLIAELARRGEKAGYQVVIVSGDKDILQLVSSHVVVWNEAKQLLLDEKKVQEVWGVAPEKISDVLALMGDTSDNVPGIPGVGPKTAVKWIQEYESVDHLLASLEKLPEKMKKKLSGREEQLKLSQSLVRLDQSVPLTVDWKNCGIHLQKSSHLRPFLEKMEFTRLIRELEQQGELSGEPALDQSVETHYQTIFSVSDLKKVVKKIQKKKIFAFDVETTGLDPLSTDLVGISLSWAVGEGVYIPVGHRYLQAPEQLSLETVRSELSAIFGNSEMRKVGHNLKFDFSVLLEKGFLISDLYFDTMLASYCLDPTRNRQGLKELVLECLGRSMSKIEDLGVVVSNKKKQTLEMDQVEIEKMTDYACADAECTYHLYEFFSEELKKQKQEKPFYELEMPLVEILAQMEKNGIAIDQVYLEGLEGEFSKSLKKLEVQVEKESGESFNLNSSKQLSHVLFEKLQLPVIKKTKTGYSTDESVLQKLSSLHAVPRLLIQYRELSKLKSTYITGLLPKIHPQTRRIHTSFHQTGTATGRFSSSQPNLQNIPIRTESGRMIRRSFIAGDQKVFLSADYSQIDLRVLAHLSQEPALCQAFQEGADIHRTTAAEVFHVPLEEVTPEQRNQAKTINFGIVYGQQAFGLSGQLGISMAEAKGLIERYFVRYAQLKGWMQEVIDSAKKRGYVETLLGHRRSIPELLAKNAAVRGFGERMAINTPVQGTSSEVIKCAMIRIGERMKENQNKQVQLLLQVHDDLLFEVPKDQVQETSVWVKQEMEQALSLKVPLKVDLKSGENWADLNPIEKS